MPLQVGEQLIHRRFTRMISCDEANCAGCNTMHRVYTGRECLEVYGRRLIMHVETEIVKALANGDL
jgi:hypothetical protein